MRKLLRNAGWLAFMVALGSTGGIGQEPLLLRQAIQQALKQNPNGNVACANAKEATAGVTLARSQLLPQLSFTEDMSRGNDPVYVFGTKLRQQRFTATDFALSSLNRPSPVGNFASRLSGSWQAFDSFRIEKTIRSAEMMRDSAATAAKAVDQQIVFDVVHAYQAVLYAERQ